MTAAQLQALEEQLLAAGVVSFDTVQPALPVHWLSSRTINLRGYPLEGPAISYEKGEELFTFGWTILDALDNSTITVEHDEEWYTFPELGVAYQKATDIENYYAVAFSARFSRWGVGFAGSKKGRESAARLALAVAIATVNPQLTDFFCKYPGFPSLCGISTSGGSNVVNTSRGFAEGPAAPRGFAEVPAAALPGMPPSMTGMPASMPGVPTSTQPQIFWVSLRAGAEIMKQGLPSLAAAIVHDDLPQDLFTRASILLDDVIGKDNVNVAFDHVADWSKSPDVGSALKTAIGARASESSFCVATCLSLKKWAVGLAWGRKDRESSAKLALAYQIALTSGRMEDLMRDHPEFKRLYEFSGAAGDRPTVSDGLATKRPRLMVVA